MAKTKDSKNQSTTKDEENQRRKVPTSQADKQPQPTKQTPNSEL
jgi:hypothetical protein